MAPRRHIRAAVGNTGHRLAVEELAIGSRSDLERDGALDGALLEDDNLSGSQLRSVQLAEVALRRVDLRGAELSGAHLRDVHASALNGANGRWRHAKLARVTVENSTLVGLDLSTASLASTTFENCKLDLANLRQSSIKDTLFSGCSLRGADFQGAKLASVRFEGCELEDCDFSQAQLASVDLRTSTIATIHGAGSLSGALIDNRQLIELAPSLAAELGIVVEDELPEGG